MSLNPKAVSAVQPGATRVPSATVAPAVGDFVINLCSSTTPMALAKPKDPALARFTFFVSRRLEDGRERFRLHMGYFPSMVVAEEWLAVVREVYPGAWAGDAPGRKLAARSAAAPVATPAAPAAPASAAAPAPPAAPKATPAAPAPPTATLIPPATAVPTVHAAPVARSSTPPTAAKAQPEIDDATVIQRAPAERSTTLPQPAAPKPAPTKPAVSEPALSPPSPLSPAAVAAKAALKSASAPGVRSKVAAPESNIREVLAELDELTDTQTLRVLEGRNAPDKSGAKATYDEAIPLVRPDDTLTMRAIKADVQRQAPVSFAVQLEWSVTPIDASKVPPLAIFNAYTLYTTEANRQGRRWYGLRLGFFSDAISAKQVAYYIRSDFGSVAVVPVAAEEKEKATRPKVGDAAMPLVAATEVQKIEQDVFRLLDDDTPPPIELDVVGESSPRAVAKKSPPPVVSRNSVKTAVESARPRASKSARLSRQSAKAKSSAGRLDETLEILGADQLDFDKGRGELISDSGVRHLRVHVDRRSSKFTSLLDRIAQKLGRG
ncbi:MAG: hypothetical protein IPG25_01775 [Proteobacteria bacterium]|nr:hypothetical protein [Pseudomonadota bacterium]